VFAVALVVAGACGSSTETTALSLASGAPITAPVPSPTLAPVQLTGSTYKVTPAATTGGSVVLAEWELPDTVNPYFALKVSDHEVSASMFDSLLSITPDLKYVPDLATKVPTLDNGGVTLVGSGMDVAWNLKPDMKWSDSQPINCDDLKATWQWIMNKDNIGLAAGTIGWQDISGVDGGVGTDCVMHFSVAYEGYLNLVSPLLPAHYLSTVAVKDAPTKLYPLGSLSSGVYSGPYIPSLKTTGQITLKPNPNWQTIGGHAPWLNSVIWKYYGDAVTMIDGYTAGGFDVGQHLSESDISALSSVNQAQVKIADSFIYEFHTFNNAQLKATYGADATTIVNAVKLATDRQAIATGPLAGSVSAIDNFVSPLAWYYEAPRGRTTADPATASTLLANAGWTKGADGNLTKGGKTLELNYCSTNLQVRLDTLKLVASQLKQVGIKVNISTKPATDVFGLWDKTKVDTLCNLPHGNFDVAEFSRASSLDPLGGYDAYHSSRVPEVAPHGGGNVSRISLPALDAAYDTIRTSVDFSKVRAAMASIQGIYGSDRNTYELPLYFRKDIWLVSSKVHNLTGNPMPAGAEWNIGDWWVG
jgi:peptide/nickel transport system substrate-binding protein